jgi:hypothetical protein
LKKQKNEIKTWPNIKENKGRCNVALGQILCTLANDLIVLWMEPISPPSCPVEI